MARLDKKISALTLQDPVALTDYWPIVTAAGANLRATAQGLFDLVLAQLADYPTIGDVETPEQAVAQMISNPLKYSFFYDDFIMLAPVGTAGAVATGYAVHQVGSGLGSVGLADHESAVSVTAGSTLNDTTILRRAIDSGSQASLCKLNRNKEFVIAASIAIEDAAYTTWQIGLRRQSEDATSATPRGLTFYGVGTDITLVGGTNGSVNTVSSGVIGTIAEVASGIILSEYTQVVAHYKDGTLRAWIDGSLEYTTALDPTTQLANFAIAPYMAAKSSPGAGGSSQLAVDSFFFGVER